MLQRIQTIWLFLAGAAAFITLKLPMYSGSKDAAATYSELNGVTGGILILIFTVAVGIIAFITTALYKNRPVQIKLCFAGLIVELFVLFLYYRQATLFIKGSIALYAILHLCIIIFFLLAARNISKDEKLIKDSDRLR